MLYRLGSFFSTPSMKEIVALICPARVWLFSDSRALINISLLSYYSFLMFYSSFRRVR